jgi:predicted DNA-binding transcriptional regulator AlpA
METIITTDDLLTTEELARITGLAPITLQHWRATGHGPAFLKLGRAVRYEREAVAQFYAQNRAA